MHFHGRYLCSTALLWICAADRRSALVRSSIDVQRPHRPCHKHIRPTDGHGPATRKQNPSTLPWQVFLALLFLVSTLLDCDDGNERAANEARGGRQECVLTYLKEDPEPKPARWRGFACRLRHSHGDVKPSYMHCAAPTRAHGGG